MISYIRREDRRKYSFLSLDICHLPQKFGLSTESLGLIYELCRRVKVPSNYHPFFSDRLVQVRVLKSQAAVLSTLLEECLSKDCPSLSTITRKELIELHNRDIQDRCRGKVVERDTPAFSCSVGFLKRFSWAEATA